MKACCTKWLSRLLLSLISNESPLEFCDCEGLLGQIVGPLCRWYAPKYWFENYTNACLAPQFVSWMHNSLIDSRKDGVIRNVFQESLNSYPNNKKLWESAMNWSSSLKYANKFQFTWEQNSNL